MKFISFNRGWADEFDVYGFAIMSDDAWKVYSDALQDRASVSYQFGTNEGWDDEPGADFLMDMDVHDLSESEVQLLVRIFKIEQYEWQSFMSWGNFPSFNFDENDQDEW